MDLEQRMDAAREKMDGALEKAAARADQMEAEFLNQSAPRNITTAY